MKKIFPLTALFILLLCHLPFLTADPDTTSDIHTRGAWTDEGLYSSQLRNYLIDGHFDITENSTFVRGPLFNLVQLPFFYIFGSNRLVARLIVLLVTFTVPLLFLRFRGLEIFTFFLLLTVYGQFHVFSFSHYALAEMLCIDMALVALFFILKAQTDKALFAHRVWYVLLASVSLFVSYSLKIQFVYLAALLPLTLFVMAFTAGKEREEAFQLFGLSLVFTALFAGIYGIWYAVNKDLYDTIMIRETAGRYPGNIAGYLPVVKANFLYFLWVRELKPLWVAIPAAILVILWQWHSTRTAKHWVALWVFSLLWIFIELHKIPMSYLPNRYLLPLFVAAGLLIAQSLTHLSGQGMAFTWIAVLSGMLLLGSNLPFVYQNYRQRSYDLTRLNQYLDRYSFEGRTGLGSWAAAASWRTDLRTKPVWYDYFNADRPLERYRPAIVVTEADQSESDRTYQQQGTDLLAMSDSMRSFAVWRYDVRVYWLKKQVPLP